MVNVMGMVLPYVALIVLLVGMLFRIAGWLRTPVPFHLTLFPAPRNRVEKIRTIVAEFLLCRPLFHEDRLFWIWFWLFHLSLVMVIFGHVFGIYFLREQFTLIGISPELSRKLSVLLGSATGAIMALSLFALLCRRIFSPQVRRLSKPDNYFDLLLLIAIALTGLLMYVPGFHTEMVDVRAYMAGLLLLAPVPLPNSSLFIIHFLLVNLLMLYFPFSRLSHLAGFFIIRLILTEAPPIYPTSVHKSPRSDFAIRKIHPDIPFSLKKPRTGRGA